MRWLAFTGALVALAAGPAAAAYRIGIFADSTATTCSLQVDQRTLEYMWVVALLDDALERPIVGAEFRLMGFPTDWDVSLEPQYPGRVLRLLGGIVLAFYDRPPVSGGILPLFKLGIVARSPVRPTRV